MRHFMRFWGNVWESLDLGKEGTFKEVRVFLICVCLKREKGC